MSDNVATLAPPTSTPTQPLPERRPALARLAQRTPRRPSPAPVVPDEMCDPAEFAPRWWGLLDEDE